MWLVLLVAATKMPFEKAVVVTMLKVINQGK